MWQIKASNILFFGGNTLAFLGAFQFTASREAGGAASILAIMAALNGIGVLFRGIAEKLSEIDKGKNEGNEFSGSS